MRSPLLLTVSFLATAVALGACSVASPGAGSSAGSPAGASASPAASTAPAPVGAVSTDGVCGLVPIEKVNSILGTSYANSKEVAIPELTMADAAYCTYTPASGPDSDYFVIQVATSDPSDAVATFNEAAGGVLAAQSGIGDSALYSASLPELVVVWGQTAISVGQSAGGGEKPATLSQLEKLATAVHSAA